MCEGEKSNLYMDLGRSGFRAADGYTGMQTNQTYHITGRPDANADGRSLVRKTSTGLLRGHKETISHVRSLLAVTLYITPTRHELTSTPIIDPESLEV